MNLRGSGGRVGRLGWGIGKWRNYVKTVLTYFVLNKRVQYSQVKKQAVGLFSQAKFIITLASDLLDYCQMRWREKTCKEKMLACILSSEVYLPQWKNRFYSQSRVFFSPLSFSHLLFLYSPLLFFLFSLSYYPSLSCLLSPLCSLYSDIFHWIRSLPWYHRRIGDLKPISLKRNSFFFSFSQPTISWRKLCCLILIVSLWESITTPRDELRTLPMEACLGCVNRDGQTFPLKMAPFSGGDPGQYQWEKEKA